MNNIEETLRELEAMLEEESKKKSEAKNAQVRAEELRLAAIEEERRAKESAERLAEAKARLEEARAALHDVKGNERVVVEEPVRVVVKEEPVKENTTYVINETPSKGETTVVETRTTTKKSNFGIGFISGALVLALLGTGAWVLSKEAKKGQVKASDFEASVTLVTPTPVPTVAPVATPVPTVAPTPEVSYSYNYNYDENVVTVDTTTTTKENGVVTSTETEKADYKELTTEAFEDLTAETMTELKGYGLKVSSEDVVKYVMIRNIDKLRQDNNGLITEIIGTQNVDEVFADADQVIDAIMTYNLLYFDAHQNTDGFISASIGVFDETQKARVLEIEKRVYEIGANLKDNDQVNELTYKLLRDMINPTNEMSELEDGVSYGVEWIDMYMVRSTFGTNRYGTLNEQNAELAKQFVSFAGDGEEYENNAVVNGNYRNILALLKECEKTNTRSK